MNTTIGLVFLGWLAVLLVQIFRPSARGRVAIVFSLSIFFLFYSFTTLLIPILMLFWGLAIFYIQLNAQKKYWVFSYIVVVVTAFISFKFGIIPYEEKNLLLETAIPLGFSFMMFHSIALLVDRKNGHIEKPITFVNYMASAFYFPTLPSGPFHKIQTFEDSLKNKLTTQKTFYGFCLFCMGSFKFALSGILLNWEFLGAFPVGYSRTYSLHPVNLLLFSSIFLYVNFSGFSDIVVGFSKMMGFDIPLNFRFPFFSASMAEYWRKWHITLSEWFREFVFYPLNYYILKKNYLRLSPSITTHFSVFITFLLIGLWHQFSLKILIYSFANATLVAFVFPNNKKWWGYPLTFVSALFINLLFVSQNFQSFLHTVRHLTDSIPDERIYKNLAFLGLSIFLFVFIFLAEKLIDKLGEETHSKKAKLWTANFILSVIMLFIAISWGLSHVNAVYVGY